jgi:branched-chain amino acid transport system permease protein
MSLVFWLVQTLNALALGGLLFLLSAGFSLIFGLMRIANRPTVPISCWARMSA